MAPTPTPTYTRASLTDIIARKSARVGQVGGQVGEDRRACPARGKLNAEVGEVSVSVPWNSSLSTSRPVVRQTFDRLVPVLENTYFTFFSDFKKHHFLRFF